MKQVPTAEKQAFVDMFQQVHGKNVDVVTRKQIQELVEKHGAPDPTWLWVNGEYKVGNGVYQIPATFLKKATMPKVDLNGVRDLDNGMDSYNTEKIPFDMSHSAVIP